MFILTTISDLIQISPQEFEKPSVQAIKDNINKKYSNKVVQKIGLCICLYDLLSSSEGLIGHGTGIVNVNVEFRMLVFRPFKGEIIEAKIKRSDITGIHLHTDFFDDIFVPAPVNLFDGVRFNNAESVWVWNTEGTELFFDAEEIVRFRVESEHWEDQSPQHPLRRDENEERHSPYRIVGSMSQAGLGPLLWWEEQEEEA
ncbi:RNA polymerase III subunit Rpc25 [Lepidopterella palustris CBS 459.81]|uniref:DNA-directed RNA polymerase subunit n=1 Tax=Lepidopterella palustris CBS 459.81 TaxID=1314670 RepID=A0A8E2EJN4_9PEZI|nr:RNA polymerase III subunit Rpc25 [Lepidopterella palustris CBS 459.81]